MIIYIYIFFLFFCGGDKETKIFLFLLNIVVLDQFPVNFLHSTLITFSSSLNCPFLQKFTLFLLHIQIVAPTTCRYFQGKPWLVQENEEKLLSFGIIKKLNKLFLFKYPIVSAHPT